MPNNIIDSIRLSGTTYQIQGSGGGGTQAIELTQAQYDALVDKDPNVFYIITDAEAGDLTNYYTKTETNTLLGGKADTATTYTKTEVDTALGGKQPTLVSGTNIKTINNESILGSGNIDIQGGGGKAVSGGTNISITTGETADTINCTLPITATSSVFNAISVGANSGGGSYNTLIGPNARCDNNYGHNVFLVTQNSSSSASGAYVNGTHNVIIGAIKDGYLNFGIPSFSTSQSVVIGGGGISTDKNNSVAIGYQANVSGTTKTNINNQLTIDTSNQVYIYNKDNTEMICLQDQLGGGGSSYSAGTGIDITNDVISVSGVVMSSAITTSVTSSSTDAQVPSAKAVNDKLGGLNLVKLTQAEYDALATKDSNTLYVIVN